MIRPTRLFFSCLISSTLIGLIAHHQPAVAQMSNVSRELTKATLSGEMSEIADRQNLVRVALAYCAEVEKAFPQNSPADDRWLDGEMAGEAERPLRALVSPELGRRRAQVFVRDCKSAGSGYLNDAPAFRVISIISLAHAFARFDTDTEQSAERNGVDAKKFAFLFMDTVADTLVLASLFEAAQHSR